MKIVINIGCIECGVGSNIVGIFEDTKAEEIAESLNSHHEATWRHGGQNSYTAFTLPEPNIITEEYLQYLEGTPNVPSAFT